MLARKNFVAWQLREGATGLSAPHVDEEFSRFGRPDARPSSARDAGVRIDHFLLSPALADNLKQARVDKSVRGWDHTSDQAPVWIELH